jgi:CBS domain-containing protein
MAKTLRDVMSRNPVTLPTTATVRDAATRMLESDIGDVIVLDGDRVAGILTDRDIVVRAVAEQRDPSTTKVSEICSPDVVTLSPDDSITRAIELMKLNAVRRIPVVEDAAAVGIVSIGDLAIEANGEKALADISAAKPNN